MNNAQSRILDTINGHYNHTPIEDRAAGEQDQYDKGMRGDLDHLEEVIRYVWAEAWEQAAHNPDAPAPVLTPEQAALMRADDCYAPGATYAIGGNTQARAALDTAGNNLAACDAILDIACQLAKASTDKKLPIVRHHPSNAALGAFDQHLAHIRWRLDFIEDRTTRLPNDQAARLYHELRQADRKLRAATGPLDAIKRKATKDQSIGVDKFCANCERRTVRRGGTECPTCATWRQRHGGQPRPRELDAA